jgi:hypothetical protein
MTLSATSGSLKRLRSVPWRFQQTFLTPIQNLQPFVSTIVCAREKFQGATLTIDSIVFEPENLNALLTSRSLPPSLQREASIEVAGHQEVEALLQAGLSDSVDFWFIPTPKPFVIYADHDEYTTFFANSKSNLNGVMEPLLTQGFEKVDYERNL